MSIKNNDTSSIHDLIGFVAIHRTLGSGVVTRTTEDSVYIRFENNSRELEFPMETFLKKSGDYFSHSIEHLNVFEFESRNKQKYQAENSTIDQENLEIFKKSINETLVCVLVHDKASNIIEIDSVLIENTIENCINNFIDLCEMPNSSVEELINYLEVEKDLNKLSGKYRYCSSLRDPYQGFSANNYFYLDCFIKIKTINDNLKFNQKVNRTYDEESADAEALNENYNEFINLKKLCVKEYKKWAKAYAINLTYRKCHNREDVLTFSHRLTGWSNPVYRLTENFSIEIKTNFGYGKSSYFFTKLKFKNIEIIPFSEWILYEHANFSEIIRYTKRHKLENISWHEAMTFAKSACNLSITDEEKFISEYVIHECEKMVSGLEEIFLKDSFILTTKKETIRKVDMNGRVLIEFRGEKISGALDFISAIIDYKCFTRINDFINRIELVNKKIQPILAYELMHIESDVKENEAEYSILYNELIPLKKKKDDYLKVLELIKNKIYKTKPFDINFTSLSNEDYSDAIIELENSDLEYKPFSEKFKELQKDINENRQAFNNLKIVQQKIKSYINKITTYFLNKDELTF